MLTAIAHLSDGDKPTLFAPQPYVDYRHMLEVEHNATNAICSTGLGMQVLAPTCLALLIVPHYRPWPRRGKQSWSQRHLQRSPTPGRSHCERAMTTCSPSMAL